jgi:hypothetical protein
MRMQAEKQTCGHCGELAMCVQHEDEDWCCTGCWFSVSGGEEWFVAEDGTWWDEEEIDEFAEQLGQLGDLIRAALVAAARGEAPRTITEEEPR